MLSEELLAARRTQRTIDVLKQAVCGNWQCKEPTLEAVELGRLHVVTCRSCGRKWVHETGFVIKAGREFPRRMEAAS